MTRYRDYSLVLCLLLFFVNTIWGAPSPLEGNDENDEASLVAAPPLLPPHIPIEEDILPEWESQLDGTFRLDDYVSSQEDTSTQPSYGEVTGENDSETPETPESLKETDVSTETSTEDTTPADESSTTIAVDNVDEIASSTTTQEGEDEELGSTIKTQTLPMDEGQKSNAQLIRANGTMTERDAQLFMKEISSETALRVNALTTLSWNFQTNITDHNKKKYLKGQNDFGKFSKDRWNRVQKWKTKWPSFRNETLRRLFKLNSVLGVAVLPKRKLERLNTLKVEMREIYSTRKICDYKQRTKCDLSLNPDIEKVLKVSRNYDELLHVWRAWRDEFKPTKKLYTEFVGLSNEAALLNDFPSTAEMWLHDYESDTFENDVARLYDQLKPLYQQLHAYTRRKLREIYGESRISRRGPIPAHITGNMWAQAWDNIYDILIPYPKKISVDVSEAMIKQGFTPRIMFEKADDFFASLGLERVPDSFWNNSVIEKPNDRKIVCHASAWDFNDGKDFRIKQCTRVNMDDFFTVHHELGHIQYYIQYKHLPVFFRRGANPGFHEAIGDLISLSVSTPKHLHKVGLLGTYEADYEADINFLMSAALKKVVFLPFGYLIDKYRWGIFRGAITPNNFTKAWWHYRYELQGLKPPLPRTEEDFDAAAKSHVSSNTRYIRYFVATILQFQFHKAACLRANEYNSSDPLKPLHRCDIYQSREAGKAIKEMLKSGSSKHWRVPLKAFTGSDVMDASALREYFRPLEEWLIADNQKHGEFVGWEGGFEPVPGKKTEVKNQTPVTNIQPTLPTSGFEPVPGKKTGVKNQTSVTNIQPTPTSGTMQVQRKTDKLSQDNETMTESDALLFIAKINNESALKSNALTLLSWNFQTNITDTNKDNFIAAKNAFGEFEKDRWERVQKWKTKWPTFKNKTLQRQFKRYSVLGNSALPKEKLERLNAILVNMSETYSTRKICDFKNRTKCDLSLEPAIKKILKSSRDYDELTHVWKAWRDNFRPIRKTYTEFARLSNEAAVLNDFPSSAEMWMDAYESDTFEKDVTRTLEQMKPLYEQLHAYTRRKLREVYGESRISKTGPIPAHVTGNMWAQSWENIYDILIPYPNKTSVDVTETMIKQGYTPRIMFEKADDFFASLGLERVPDSFWNNSVIEKPNDRRIVCHASAWDFKDGKDFRIKQCTTVDMEDFFTVHHELGHIQYYIQYKDLPIIFRRGANPGFHEAVGDLMSLSVSTPKHLHKVGLLDTYETDYEADINFLMSTALQKVAFLPFGYLIDKYRWELFRGNITPENYTKAWWQYRYEFQGVKPPIPRSEQDFDPAAKFHVSANYKYMRYFVAFILQFQFHKAACLRANEYNSSDPLKPLHRCDIYQSKEAGAAIRNMLKLGASEHWRGPLKAFTGSEEMDASALREYFRPLEEWLIADNQKHGEFVGWKGENIQVQRNNDKLSEDNETMTESDALLFIAKINNESALKSNALTLLSWNFEANITDYNKNNFIAAKNAFGEFEKDRWERVQKWKTKWPTFKNKTLQRQFKRYSVLGNSALPKEKLERLNAILVNMSETYSTRKICDFKNRTKCDLSLEPDIEKILKSSRDYDELTHVWKAWRENFRPIRKTYTEFARLSNEAAVLNDFPSSAEMWMDAYESDTFEKDVTRTLEQMKPLYEQLHAYTRRKLREIYGESRISKRGPIPAHVTGNMWAQTWDNIYDILIPYPNKTSVDVTNTMIKQGFTPRIMFEKADDFFASLGLESVPDSFWNNSVIEKPNDRRIVCHASAWDFKDGKDFRIKQCTTVDMEDYFTVHHELGHIQYFIQYKDLPIVFRRGANPGFHEAVGDLISLSVSTPKHLHKVGLLDTYETDYEADINFLMSTALQKVAFLPFGYLIDKYRWELFRGNITPENYTKAWWQYRYEFQGLKPPITRSEQDFDPAAKFHVSANVRYIRYFVAFILQFQFHKAACLRANEYNSSDPLKPLHRCDIYQSKEAGTAIKNMLKLGASKHWREPLKVFTGSDVMDASALREYFRPLEEWLIADNKKHGEFIGWEGDDFLQQIV